jgi:CHAT domain-containing protein
MLTVHDISELNLKHARLAYLSACSTAENKAAQLVDEVIHAVSGFQVAGFSHVIGCLWPSIDRICAAVASSFYSHLFWRGHTLFQDEDVAAALP